MAIQVRRGLKADFKPDKMLAGEWAVSIDSNTENQIVWMCFAPNVVKRMGTYDDFQVMIHDIFDPLETQITEDINECNRLLSELQVTEREIVQFKSDILNIYLPEVRQAIEDSSDNVLLSKSWAVGDTGKREGENTDNSKYYSELAKSSENVATSVLDECKEIQKDVTKKLTQTEFNLLDGYLYVNDDTPYVWHIDDNGHLIVNL